MTLEQAERDYLNDPMFRRVVDTIEHWIMEANVTPAEARMAAMLAAIHFEQRRPFPMPIMFARERPGEERK